MLARELIDRDCMDIDDGAMGALTVIEMVVRAVAAPSVTVSVTTAVPVRLAMGVIAMVLSVVVPERTMPVRATRVVLLDAAVTRRLRVGESMSPISKPMGPLLVFCVRLTGWMEVMVGASFRALTVTTKVRDREALDSPSSVTVTVIVAVPEALATGVYCSDPVVLGD